MREKEGLRGKKKEAFPWEGVLFSDESPFLGYAQLLLFYYVNNLLRGP